MPTGPAGDAAGPPAASLTVAAVARRLGVAPATLRTWDRRYGLGPSAHTAGSHRRYTPVDVERLGVMRRLTHEGVAPAEAARLALADPPSRPSRSSITSLPRPTGYDWSTARPAPASDQPPGAAPAASVTRLRPTGDGPVLRLADASAHARGLARAAAGLDDDACTGIIRASVERRGVVATWDELLVPVLVRAGERWAETGQGVDVEHMLSECALGVLRSVTRLLQAPLNPRPVLLACAENEQHSLPLHALAAALAERGVTARTLGARVPRDALAAAVRRIGPAAVFVWSQLEFTGRLEQLHHLPALRPAPLVVLGGPGWHRTGLPHGVEVADDLSGAVARLLRAAVD